MTAIAAHHPGIDIRAAPTAYEKAREAAEQAVEWLGMIRPEHQEGFWFNGTMNNFVADLSFMQQSCLNRLVYYSTASGGIHNHRPK